MHTEIEITNIEDYTYINLFDGAKTDPTGRDILLRENKYQPVIIEYSSRDT